MSVDSRNTTEPTIVVRTFDADETVEIRLALGGERDRDFDWTTFEALPIPGATRHAGWCG